MCLIQHIQTKLKFTHRSLLLFNHVLSGAMKQENEKLVRGWRSSSFPLSTMRSTAWWKRSYVAPPHSLVNAGAASSHLFMKRDLSRNPSVLHSLLKCALNVPSQGFQRLEFREHPWRMYPIWIGANVPFLQTPAFLCVCACAQPVFQHAEINTWIVLVSVGFVAESQLRTNVGISSCLCAADYNAF